MNQNKLIKIKNLKTQFEAIDPHDRHNSYKNWALERTLEGLQKTKKSMAKPIHQFIKSEITAELIGANVEIIREIKFKNKKIMVGGRPLIREGRPFKCNILLKDSTGKIWLEIYQPQENLTFYPQDKIWISNVESVFDDYWHKNKLVLTENSVITRGGQPEENIIVNEIKIEKMTK